MTMNQPYHYCNKLSLSPHLLFIGPTCEAVVHAVQELQQPWRENLLTEQEVKKFYWSTKKRSFFGGWIGHRDRIPPDHLGWFQCTQVQANLIGSRLIGFVIRRVMFPPGWLPEPPVYALTPTDPGFDPMAWLASITEVFQHNLSERELAYPTELAWDLAFQLTKKTGWAGLPPGTQEMLAPYLHGVIPAYCSRLVDGCARLAETLVAAGKDGISWREFQQCWPSLASRYARNLVPLIRDGKLSVRALTALQVAPWYTLSLGVWFRRQRIFLEPEIVFRIEAEHVFANLEETDAVAFKAFRKAYLINADVHPVHEFTIGWLRVYVDRSNRIAFCDEVQSDFCESLRKHRQTQDTPSLAAVAKSLRDWQLDGFATVRNWARRIGFRVGIHSEQSRSLISGMTKSVRKWNENYRAIIRAFHLREVVVPGYLEPICVEDVPISEAVDSS